MLIDSKIHIAFFKGFLYFSLIFLGGGIYSQQKYCIELITSDQGLSQNNVNCILQDSDEFLWFGTQDGLNRFDGLNFEYYQNDPSNTLSVSNNYILSICEDENGCIWVGTMSGGLNRFNRINSRFVRFNKESKKNNLPGNTVWCLASDRKGHVFAGTENGLSVYSIHKNLFDNFSKTNTPQKNFPFNIVYSLFVDSKNRIWVGGENGLAQYLINDNKFLLYPDVFSLVEKPKGIIWSIKENNKGQLQLGTNEGLITFNPETNSAWIYVPDVTTRKTVWATLSDSIGNVFVGTRSGLSVINANYKSCNPNLLKEINIPENNVWSLVEDKSGIIWAGCDQGVIKILKQIPKFKEINGDSQNQIYLSNESVNSMLVDNNLNLWVGTEGGGLNMIDRDQKKNTVFKKNDLFSNSISGNNIWSILQDQNGKIWIGTYGDGLSVLDLETGQFTNYQVTNNSKGLSNSRVLELFRDSKDDIWIGTRGGGLNVFRNATQEFEHFRIEDNETAHISSNTILSMAEDQFGFLWIGTFEGGVDRMNLLTNTFENFRNDPNNLNSLSNNNVYSIHFDQRGGLWLGTQGGLNYIQNPYENMLVLNLTAKQGLPSNVILGIEEDEKGNLWLSTYKGLTKLIMKRFNKLIAQGEDMEHLDDDPMNPLFKVYTKKDGLLSNEFNQSAHLKDQQGNIYFGSPNGLNYFHPDSVIESKSDPKIIITEFRIFNKIVGIHSSGIKEKANKIIKENGNYYLNKKISFYDEIILSFRESFFAFNFISLDYFDPENNRYAYFLEGFDNHWNFIGKENSASFTNLDPGTYVFRVKGTNVDGNWSRNEAVLKIIINPPFYKTTWFLLILIISLLMIIVLVIRQIIISQKRKSEKEKEKIELQLKTIKNQMDPHFAFNAMNMIGSMVYKDNPDVVYDYFSRFAGLIRTTLQDSEKISRSVEEEIQFVKNYIQIQQSRFNNNFDYRIDIDDQIDLKTEIPKMILQVHIENAIKHGLMHKKGKGEIVISLKLDGNKMIISIADNGIGRARARELNTGGTKKGMEIIHQIFELYNKLFKYKIQQHIVDLIDEKGNPLGTKVNIIIEK